MKLCRQGKVRTHVLQNHYIIISINTTFSTLIKSITQILDKAERLREMNVNILPAFLRLQEMVRLFK